MATTKNNWSTDRISNVIISNLMDYEPSMIDTLTDTFKECFPYDSQACFNPSPQIKYLNGLFTIIVPFTC